MDQRGLDSYRICAGCRYFVRKLQNIWLTFSIPATKRKLTRHKAWPTYILSGSRESNPGRTVPNRVHYHYATPRDSESRRLLCLKNLWAENQSLLLFSAHNFFNASFACGSLWPNVDGVKALLTTRRHWSDSVTIRNQSPQNITSLQKKCECLSCS